MLSSIYRHRAIDAEQPVLTWPAMCAWSCSVVMVDDLDAVATPNNVALAMATAMAMEVGTRCIFMVTGASQRRVGGCRQVSASG